MPPPLRVCVVGAGAAGLCAGRHLSKLCPDNLLILPTVFESSDVVGGTWVYTDRIGPDVHSSMYERMRTNLPKEVMAFPDFPFRPQEESFLHHTRVREYLEDYCDHFNLRDYIRFRTRVDMVEPLDQTGQWRVRTTELSLNSTSEDTFDAIVVCNGHYASPRRSIIKDVDQFKGTVLHSHDYRNPLPFRSKRVAIFGANASGVDIGIEVAGEADQVFLCHNKTPFKSKLPSNLTQAKAIAKCVAPLDFILADGSIITADILMYCTGYDFSFPFLSPSCDVMVKNQQISPLYKHMIHTHFPSMAFVGIPFQVCPFPLFDMQVQWFCKFLVGESELPSEDEMNAETEEERRAKLEAGIDERHFHRLVEAQWEYDDDLARRAGIPEVPKCVSRLYNDVYNRRQERLMWYKDDKFVLRDDGQYVLQCEKM